MPSKKDMVNQTRKLITRHSDGERHQLVVESNDWEQHINPALMQLGQIFGLPDPASWLSISRVVTETIYRMGYERGKTEHSMPSFVIPNEEVN